jgi:hypothetical protein
MLILGLLLVLASAAAVALLVAYNNSGGPEQMIVLFGRDLVSVTPLQAFISGLVAALVFAIGVWMIVSAGRRGRMTRAQYREARREARVAAKERDQLAKQLADRPDTVERERPAGWTPPEQAAPAASSEPTTHRGIGRHFRRTDRTDEAQAEQPASSPPK